MLMNKIVVFLTFALGIFITGVTSTRNLPANRSRDAGPGKTIKEHYLSCSMAFAIPLEGLETILS